VEADTQMEVGQVGSQHSCKGSIHNVVVFSIAQMLCIQYEPGENKSFT